MAKKHTFGNAKLTEKMKSEFGDTRKPIKVKMQYSQECRVYIQKIEDAHKKAAKSTLIFK